MWWRNGSQQLEVSTLEADIHVHLLKQLLAFRRLLFVAEFLRNIESFVLNRKHQQSIMSRQCLSFTTKLRYYGDNTTD